ncbi:hypothetical protein RIF29_28570 [Crotalaria pallida]|uniref:F-box/LRR-repeat protein 15-like leucin rich repeat domain-containing protein n=1 Tax=Crotalaria pallida TaxID=3830 RepID=A0AAN9EFA4_CROPI
MTTTLNSLAFINNRVSPANAYADLLHIIAESFPFLEQLHIHCFHLLDDHLKVEFCSASDYAVKALASALPKLRKVRFSGGHLINDSSLFHLCKNCQFLEELLISEGFLITQPGIASAIKEGPNLTLFSVRDMARQKPVSDLVASFASMRNLTCLDLSRWIISDELLFSVANAGIPLTKLELQGCVGYSYAGISCLLSKCQLIQHLNLGFAEFLEDEHITWLSVFCVSLMFINLSGCRKLTNLSLFALIRNCPLLSEIKMEQTAIGENGALDASMDFFVKPSIKSLHLSYNKRLRDESIKLFASICPNLEILVLDFFKGNGIVDVLKRCPRIRHLSLSIHSKKGLLSGMMNFQFPKLEVLKLSDSAIDDESLFVISVSCHGLLHLDVQGCPWITTKGVKQVIVEKDICSPSFLS